MFPLLACFQINIYHNFYFLIGKRSYDFFMTQLKTSLNLFSKIKLVSC